MKLLTFSLKDRSQREHGDLPPYGRAVKFLRRLLRLKDPADDAGGAPLRPSMLERLDEFFAHDRTRLNEVLPEDLETPSSSEPGGLTALDQAEPDSRKDQGLGTELAPTEQTEIGPVPQSGTANAKESLVRSADATAVHSVHLAAQEAIAQLQVAHQEMEARLRSFTRDYERRQAELSSAIERASSALPGVQQKITNEAVEELEKAAGDLLNRTAKQLREQADAALAPLGKELQAGREACIEEAKKELASLTRASLESLTKATLEECRSQLAPLLQEQAQAVPRNADAAVQAVQLAGKEAVAQLQRAQQESEASLKGQAGEHQKRLAELLTVMEELQRKWGVLLESQVQDNLQRFRPRVRKEVADQFEDISKEILDRTAKQLQEQAETTQAALGERLRASEQGFIEAMKQQLVTMAQTSSESLFQETTELSRSQLRRVLQESVAQGARELQAEHRELLKKHGEAMQKQFAALSQARPKRGYGEFTRAEHATERRVAGLRAGLKVGVGLAAAALILVAIYASAPAGMQLRAEPPAGFFDQRPDWNAKQRAREEQLARAYWALAGREVQATYRFGMKLPDDPPAQFKVEEKNVSGSGLKVDPVARTRYWGKLRQVWDMPEAWERSPRWYTGWIRSAVESAKFK